MCVNCSFSSLSRRQFLRLASAAGLSTILTACRIQNSPPSGQLQGHDRVISIPTTAVWPTVAGTISAYNRLSLTINAPLGRQTFLLADNIRFLDANGHMHKLLTLMAGESVALWLNGSSQKIQQIHQLPLFSTQTERLPTLVQPAPTGETQSFGSLALITRSGWGAAAPDWQIGGESGLYDAVHNPDGWLVYEDPLAAKLHTLVVHHSALSFTDGPREIQALHVQTNRFADIGYHFLIDGLGQLYEGRPLNVRGAHTGGYNTGCVGVCLLGNFEIIDPTEAQWETLKQLAIYLQSAYTISYLGGHLDFQPGITACPGQRLLPYLPTLAQEFGLQYGRPN